MNKNPVIEFSCKHPVSVLSVLLAITVLSCISLKTIGQNYLPKTGDRYILVSTEFEGVSAEQMRKLVTIVVEDAVASLKIFLQQRETVFHLSALSSTGTLTAPLPYLSAVPFWTARIRFCRPTARKVKSAFLTRLPAPVLQF